MNRRVNEYPMSHGLTIVIDLVVYQSCSARTPSKLLDVTCPVAKSLNDVVNIIAEMVNVGNILEAFKGNIEM